MPELTRQSTIAPGNGVRSGSMITLSCGSSSGAFDLSSTVTWNARGPHGKWLRTCSTGKNAPDKNDSISIMGTTGTTRPLWLSASCRVCSRLPRPVISHSIGAPVNTEMVSRSLGFGVDAPVCHLRTACGLFPPHAAPSCSSVILALFRASSMRAPKLFTTDPKGGGARPTLCTNHQCTP